MYSFPDLEPVMFVTRHVVACPVLTVASWPAYTFLTQQVRWSGIPISLRKARSRGKKKIKKNNRKGKTRDLFKKIRNTKGTFHAKMGSIKDRNGMDLREAEDINKRWQEYTEELYKKDLHDPANHGGVITHLEPDILECEGKWVLGSITTNKASGSDGIPVELFQVLKDDAVKVLHSICQQIWKTQEWPQDWPEKVSFHSNPKERQCQRIFKLPHNCTHLTC